MKIIKTIFANDYAAMLFCGIAGGLLSTLSLAPYNLPLVVYFCSWPLFYLAERLRHSVGKMLLAGAIFSFFLCVFSFYWILHTLQEFGGLGAFLSGLIFVPYSILLNLKIPLFLVVFGLSMREKWKGLAPGWFLAGVLGTAADYFSPQIFPWYWGNLLAGNNFLLQTAEITGIYGLTFLLFAFSYFLYSICGSIIRRESILPGKNRAAAVLNLSPAPVMMIVCLIFGTFRRGQMEDFQKTLPTVRVAQLQPNSPLEKSGESHVTDAAIDSIVTDAIPRMAQQLTAAGGKIDLIVLPESAVPYYTTQDNVLTRYADYYKINFELMVQLLAYNHNADVFFNEIAMEPVLHTGETRPRVEIFNSSVLYSRDGARRGFYHKRELLAWGEYIPGVEFLEQTGLIFLVPRAVRFSRFGRGRTANLISYSRSTTGSLPPESLSHGELTGKTPQTFQKEFPADRAWNPAGQFLPLICYEILKPEYVRSFFLENRENPGFMVNITQDGWYGRTAETFQHYELGRIRAVETRRAIVRSTNSGSSGFVDIAGNYAQPTVGSIFSEQEAQALQIWDVPVNSSPYTFYVKFGNLWLLLPFLSLLILVLIRLIKNRKNRNSVEGN